MESTQSVLQRQVAKVKHGKIVKPFPLLEKAMEAVIEIEP